MRRFLVLATLLAAVAAFWVPSVARADERVAISVAAPLPLSTATVASGGFSASYDVVHLPLVKGSDLMSVGLAPSVTVENVVGYSAGHYSLNSWRSTHIEPGLFATFSVWHVTAGVGEVLRPGATLYPSLAHFSPTIFAGIRL